ncbi:MAG: S41 family peptidase [Burkholderiales bacterium]|nr:S41 family peptidase [Burkholderiales bacterium]
MAVGSLVALGLLAVQALRANPRLSPEQIEATLVEAQRLMQERALFGTSVDWPGVLMRARQTAARTHRAADLDEALQGMVWAIREHDAHSFYLPAAQARRMQSGTAPGEQVLLQRGADLGQFQVLQMPGYMGMDEAVWKRDAAAGASRLTELLRARPCGLVLDLRQNSGGNMYPMFLALAALLPPRDVGYFEDRARQRMPFPLPPRQAAAADVAVAVLIGPSTASSGEFLAIGLRSLPRVRSFGAPTAGLATGVQPMPLPNGGLLGVTEVRALDFEGRAVGRRVLPDQVGSDPLVDARNWLNDQCRPRP